MARYTCSFTLALPIENLHASLIKMLESCHFEMIYDTDDYVMGREAPGQVAFAKLVTVEGLMDKPKPDDKQVRINLVIKNEELPLQTDNHCSQIFDKIKQAISDNESWKLIELVSSPS
jgi:hypothetical protein